MYNKLIMNYIQLKLFFHIIGLFGDFLFSLHQD